MSLHFNMLPKSVTGSLPRSKCLLISWLQSRSTVVLEPEKLKSVSVYSFSPSICHEEMGSDTMILLFECRVLSQHFDSPLSPARRCSLDPPRFLP